MRDQAMPIQHEHCCMRDMEHDVTPSRRADHCPIREATHVTQNLYARYRPRPGCALTDRASYSHVGRSKLHPRLSVVGGLIEDSPYASVADNMLA